MTSPKDLGLPFNTFRPGQLEMAQTLAAADERFSVLSAPPGSGKSLIYMTLAKLLGAKRTLILVSTKALQEQLHRDFESAAVMKGRGNYPCRALWPDGELHGMGPEGGRCDVGPCTTDIYCSLQDDGCDYYDDQGIARGCNDVIANYHYWLSLGKYKPDGLGRFDLLILDECHKAIDILGGFCSVVINHNDLQDVVGSKPRGKNKIPKSWAKLALGEANIQLRRSKKRESSNLIQVTGVRNSLQRLVQIDKGWVRDDEKEKFICRPVWSSEYAEKSLFRGVERVVAVSATVRKTFSERMGFEGGYYEMERTFPVERRLIIYCDKPEVKLCWGMGDDEKKIVIDKIDTVISKECKRKGIIHTNSYDLNSLVTKNCLFKDLMITHGRGGVQDAVDKFKGTNGPCILVSPALKEGYDFPADECRWQIIVKIPFLNLKDPVICARKLEDEEYYYDMVSQSMEQMSGRPMRADDDWCRTYIIDGHWRIMRQRGVFSKSFRLAWRFESLMQKEEFIDG